MQSARPGTASGGRPQTAREGFTVRVRTDKATIRCVLNSDTATVRELRSAIALQSSIPVDRQCLTRERRHWFDAAAAPGTALTHDDFTDDSISMQAAGIAHGDMLYVIAKPARPDSSADSDVAPASAAADDDEEDSVAEGAASAPPALQRNTSLVFRGWLADEVESAAAVAAAQSAAVASQSAATELLQSIRAAMRQARGDPALDRQMEELSRLIPLCGPSGAWASTAASASEAAAAKPALPAEQSSADSASSLIRARPSSSSRGSSHGAPQNQELDDGGNSSLGNSRPSSGARSASATPAAASADPVADLTAELAYWRGRYDRLRVKAEKMNAAGLSLQNSMDVAALQHEKALLLIKGRLAKRDAKLAIAERTIRAWQLRDRQEWGGDGSIELSPEDRQDLTSLAAAPSMRATQRMPQQPQLHQPTPPQSGMESASSAAGSEAAPRRVRPESAGRFRSSRPSSGDAAGHPAATVAAASPSFAAASSAAIASAPLHSPPPAASSSPLVRPSSASRSRRATGPSSSGAAAAAAAAPSASPLSSDSWTSAAPALSFDQAEAVALQASLAQQQLQTSRSQVRQAVDSAKHARVGLAGSRGSALVAGPYAREL